MKLMLLGFVVLSLNAFAQAKSAIDFVAPVVANEASLSATPTGLIFFDLSTPGLKVIDNAGDAILLTPVENNVSSQGTTEVIQRATLNCDAGSAITSQSGTWISSIGNISGGACSITIATGIFASAPACVGSVKTSLNGDPLTISVNSTSTTAFTIDCAEADAGGDCTSYDVDVICMGSK